MRRSAFVVLALVAWRCSAGLPQQPWHHPDAMGTNQDFQRFAITCLKDSLWIDAQVIVEVQGAIKQIEAVKDRATGKTFFLANGDMRWVVESGRLDSNLSASLVQGYNGGSESFVWRDQLHSLGGYGLWRRHFDFLRFEGGADAWQLLGVTGAKPEDRDVDHSIAYTRNGVCYVLEEMLERRPYSDSEFILRTLDLASREWSERGIVDPRLGSLSGGIGMGDRWILRNHAGELVVIALDSMVARVLPNQARELNAFLGWNREIGRSTFVYGDSALHVFKGERKTFKLPYNWQTTGSEFSVVDESRAIPSKEAINTAVKDSGLASAESHDERNSFLQWLPWGLVALLSVFLLKGQIGKPKEDLKLTEGMHQARSHMSPITEKIMKREGDLLETEELDRVLGISHLVSPETLRSQRARTINRVNTEYRMLHGTDLIVRKQSQEDRRRSVYAIHARS